MEDCCAVCAETLEWVSYGPCGHREVCSTCVVRLRFILSDRRCCICKTECPTVFVTRALGHFTDTKVDFSEFPLGVSEGQHNQYWYHEESQAYFDDVDIYSMIKAMCRLSCSICDSNADDQSGHGSNRRNKFRNLEQLKGHLYHQHKVLMCTLCLEGKKVFVSEQKLYTRSQLKQHISSGDSEVDRRDSEHGGFAGHPMCEFCRNPFYGDAELYMHMSTEHYTCHLCKRLRPDQYDYYSNYDDLEAHFHQEHFLCENEACLAKKFVVFQSEAEIKRHNAMEHGGHMSRSKRNSALQIPVSFRYRRTNEQDQRRGRREFHPGPSNLVKDAAEGESHELPSGGKTNGEDGQTRQADIITNSAEAQAVCSGYESSGKEPSVPYLDLPKPSIRYALAVSQGVTAKLGESSFPPLPGAESKIKNPAALSEGLPANPLAARIDILNKGSVTGLHPASAKLSKFYEAGSSSLSSSSKIRLVSKSHDLAQSNSNPGAANQFAQLFSSSNQAKPIIGNQFTASVHINSVRNSNVATRLKHSASAPSLTSSAPSNNPWARTVSVATSNQELPTPTNSLQNLENVHRANKSLVENIRVALGMDEEKYAAFKTISAEYRLNQINTWEYLSYVEQFGLSHLIFDLAHLCPDLRKQVELIDAYNANIRRKGPEENNSSITIGVKKERKKGKGKQKAMDHEEKIATKDALADSFLDQVRKLQLAQYQIEDEVDVLSKDGYRTTKDKVPLGREGKAPTLTAHDPSSVSGKENMESKNKGSGDRSKKNPKKSQRIRLGDGSAAALLDRRHEETSSSNTTQADGLPIRGVWRNGGGQRLFSETGTTK